jgi:hypothetical protein
LVWMMPKLFPPTTTTNIELVLALALTFVLQHAKTMSYEQKAKNSSLMTNPTIYHSAVGKLMYAMVATQPDIAFAISFAEHFMHSPTNAH